MEVSFEIDKISDCAIHIPYRFFPSGGGVDMLMRLPLIKQIIKDVNLMLLFIQCHTSTDILGMVNEFVQYVRYYF